GAADFPATEESWTSRAVGSLPYWTSATRRTSLTVHPERTSVGLQELRSGPRARAWGAWSGIYSGVVTPRRGAFRGTPNVAPKRPMESRSLRGRTHRHPASVVAAASRHARTHERRFAKDQSGETDSATARRVTSPRLTLRVPSSGSD